MTPFFFGNGKEKESRKDKYKAERERMAKYQLERRDIDATKVLEAFRKVKRHRFVPDEYKGSAYDDSPLPIGSGQTISQPYIVAYMTQELELEKTDKVLEVGTGSGYQAAILAELCDSVFTIEIFESLSERAKKATDELGYDNIYFKVGDGFKGWEENAPYDAIIVTCAPKETPPALKKQLAEDGKMIIPVGRSFSQSLILYRKIDGELLKEKTLPVRFVPMIDSSGQKY